MADLWTLFVLLAAYIGACDAAICTSVSRSFLGGQRTNFVYCSYGCCGTAYNRYCCTSSGTVAGIVIAVIAGIFLLAFFVYMCVKKQKRPGRVVMPHSNISHSNVTVFYGHGGPGSSSYRGGPPVPPPYKAHDPPPPYTQGGRRINTTGIHEGSYPGPAPSWQAPPSGNAPSWQAPPPGVPPTNNNPPMPQPDVPPRIQSPAPPYSAVAGGRMGNNPSNPTIPGTPEPSTVPTQPPAVYHPPPGPIPPSTAPHNTQG